MKNDLPEMTEVEEDYYWWSKRYMVRFGKANPVKPHVYTRTDNQQKIVLLMSYSENFARQYSNGSGQTMCIRLADGVECFYDQQATHRAWYGGNRGIETAGNYPMASYALGVDDEDLPEQRAKDLAAGVVTEYNGHGEPIFVSKKHRKEYCEAHGYIDRNAGYSDPVSQR